MSIKTITVTGTVREFKQGYKFLFLIPTYVMPTDGVDVFVPMTLFKQNGITRQIASGATMTVEAFQQSDGRWRANRIVKLDGCNLASTARGGKSKRPARFEFVTTLKKGDFAIGKLAFNRKLRDNFNHERGFGFVRVIAGSDGGTIENHSLLFVHISSIPDDLRTAVFDGAQFTFKVEENKQGLVASVYNLVASAEGVAAE